MWLRAVVVEEVKTGGSAANAGIQVGCCTVFQRTLYCYVYQDAYIRQEPVGVRMQVGDLIMEVSAVTLKAGKEGEYEAEGYGQRPFDNFEKSMMSCVGQSFDTIMSAISSNNPRWGYTTVDLVILRPDEP